MIVIDASAMIEALVGASPAAELLDAIEDDVHTPHLLDIEVLSVLRGLTLSGKLRLARAEEARADFFDLRIERHATDTTADRVWRLRHQFTAYDASYLALAEALDAPLHTCDTKLRSRGHHATVIDHPRSA